MKYWHRIEKYKVVGKFTVKEILESWRASGCNRYHCPLGATDLMDNGGREPLDISGCWSWIEEQRGNKKLTLLVQVEDSVGFTDA